MNFNNESQWLRKNSIILINASKIREAFPVNKTKQKTEDRLSFTWKKSKLSLT